jgi:hypothetical protein
MSWGVEVPRGRGKGDSEVGWKEIHPPFYPPPLRNGVGLDWGGGVDGG